MAQLPESVVAENPPPKVGGDFYTYMHTRNDTERPFYIGKGKGNRAYQGNPARRSQHWNRVARKHGWSVQILARWDTDQDAHAHEIFLISCMRSIGIDLVNQTDGGDGTSGFKWKAESREKLRASVTGVTKSVAHRSALKVKKTMTAKLRAKHLAMKGVKATPEQKAKFLASNNVKQILCVGTGSVFESAASAIRWLISIGWPKAQNGPILKCCKGTAHTAYGHKWSYAKEEKNGLDS